MEKAKPLPLEEARSLAKQHHFEHYLEKESAEKQAERERLHEERVDAIAERETTREREIRNTRREFLRIVAASWSKEERIELDKQALKLPYAHNQTKPKPNEAQNG